MSSAPLHGVLPVDKPEGVTSHDVVAAARRGLAVRRIGHTGTLDPFASGLLLLCVGEATRLAEFLTGMDKTYEAVLLLGVSTDSGDRDGLVLRASDAGRTVSQQDFEAGLARFQGELDQLPPSLSAKKVGGVPAHRRVRRGEAVVLSPQRVTVHELTLLAFEAPQARIRVRCSSGTYVRALARDLGEALGVGAHLTGLRRTAVGPHTVQGALAPEELAEPGKVEGALLPPVAAMAHLPRWEVDGSAAADLAQGKAVTVLEPAESPVAAVTCGGRLVAVGRVHAERFHPRKVLAHG